jgi:hypothetical protein
MTIMPDGGALRVRLFSMLRAVRTAFAYLVAAFLLLGGTLVTPDTVLCVGPGNHYHLETVLGASCSGPLSASDGSAPRPRDGCPQGSRDLRLSVDTHRSDNPPDAATFTQVLTVPTGVVELSEFSNEQPRLVRLPRMRDSQSLTVILRC